MFSSLLTPLLFSHLYEMQGTQWQNSYPPPSIGVNFCSLNWIKFYPCSGVKNSATIFVMYRNRQLKWIEWEGWKKNFYVVLSIVIRKGTQEWDGRVLFPKPLYVHLFINQLSSSQLSCRIIVGYCFMYTTMWLIWWVEISVILSWIINDNMKAI